MHMRDFFHNCLDVEWTDLGWCPVRCTPEQLEYYDKLDEGETVIGGRARSSAGVYLSFYTDLATISFDYAIRFCSHDWVIFDIYENDVLTEQIKSYRQTHEHVFYQRRSANISKVTIYLPYDCETCLSNLDLGDAMPCPEEEGPRLLALGDSITQGMRSSMPSLTWTSILQRHLGGDMLNQGVGQMCFDPELPLEVPFTPDVVTVAYGTNDVDKKDLIRLKRDTRDYLIRVKEQFSQVPIYVITPIWRSEIGRSKFYDRKTEEARYFIEQCAEALDLHVIDGYKLVPHMKEFFHEDGLHPNETGFEAYAVQLIKQIMEND